VNSEITKHGYLMVLSFILSSVLGYLYQMSVGLLLPKSEFGIIGVAFSTIYVASVLTQNTFSWTATKLIAADLKDAQKILRTTLAGNFILSLLVSAVVLTLSLNSKTYFLPMVIVAASLITASIANSYASLLRGVKKFGAIAFAGVFSSALKLFISIVLILAGLGALGGLLGLFVSTLLVTVYFYLTSRTVRLSKSAGWSFSMVIETIPVSMTFLGIAFLMNASILFLRYMGASDAIAGDYNAALTIARAPYFLAGALVTVAFSYVSSEFNKEGLAFQSLKYTVLFILPLCVSMAIDPGSWLNLFFAKKYMGGAECLRFLALGMAFIAVSQVISSNLVAMDNYKISAIILVAASCILIILTFILPRQMEFYALSVAISSFISMLVLLIYYSRKYYLNVSVSHMAKLFVSYLLLALPLVFIPPDGRLISLVELFMSLFVYVISLAVTNLLDEKDIENLLSPLPDSLKMLARKVVVKLNSIGL